MREVVDGGVGADHPLGAGQVGLEEGLGTGGDGIRDQEAEPHHIDPQLAELAVVGVPDLVHRQHSLALRAGGCPACPVPGRGSRVVHPKVRIRLRKSRLRLLPSASETLERNGSATLQTSTAMPPLVTPVEGGTAERPGADREVVFAVSDLDVYYGTAKAVAGVTCDIGSNQVTAIIGPSGCGKSTLLRCFNRIHDLYPDTRYEGKIILQPSGTNVIGPETDPVEMRLRVSMVFQKPNAFPKSVFENAAFGLRLRGVGGKELEHQVEHSLRLAALWDEVKD